MFRRHENITEETTSAVSNLDDDDATRAVATDMAIASDTGTSRQMNAHRFDGVSALLGIATLAGAAIVIGGRLDPFSGQETGVWITGAAVLAGIAILPWGARTSRRQPDPTDG